VFQAYLLRWWIGGVVSTPQQPLVQRVLVDFAVLHNEIDVAGVVLQNTNVFKRITIDQQQVLY
jgi:hypothetical protein